MTDFILKLFVKNYDDKKNPDVRRKCGMAVSVIGIIVNLFLAAFKLVAGVLSANLEDPAVAIGLEKINPHPNSQKG